MQGGSVSRKPHDDDDLSFTLTLKVVSVEVAEIG